MLANGIDVGLAFARVELIPGLTTWDDNLPKFWAIHGFIANLVPVGLPDGFRLSFEGVAVDINRGGPISTFAGSEAWINWEKSFPNSDPTKVGLKVPTGEGNDPTYVNIDDPILGISATRVVLVLSDFVYISGGFAFEQGGREDVDIDTSGTGLSTIAGLINASGACEPSNTDPGTLCATASGSTFWNIPVVTTKIGIYNASVFIGYNPIEPVEEGEEPNANDLSFDPGEDGTLDESDLSTDAAGLLANGITVAVAIAKVEQLLTGQTWRKMLPTFIAIDAMIAKLIILGLPPDLVFDFTGIGLAANHGGKVGAVAGSNAWVNWEKSFPEQVNDEGEVTRPAGLKVDTGTGNPPVYIDFDDPIIRVEAERVVISIYGFVHISGGFFFEKGGIETVVIDTGLRTDDPTLLAACAALLAGAEADAAAGGTAELSSDCAPATPGNGEDITLSGVKVQTTKIGISNASIFIGYNPSPECLDGAESCPTFDTGDDGILQQTELDPDAVGFLAGGINFGFVMANFLPGVFTQTVQAGMAGKLPSFYAIKAHMDELALIGIPGIVLEALDANVEVNVGGKWTTASNALSPPTINWAASFPDSDLTDDEVTPGFEIPTGGNNTPLVLVSEGFLIAGGVSSFTMQIADFVYVAGSFYFEFGPVETMPITAGVIDATIIAELDPTGTLANFVGGGEKALQFLKIGAQDVHMFVGIEGPYWVDTNGNGVIDRDSEGQIVDSEVNEDAIGLVIDDVDFALAIGTPVLRLDPTRYIALTASAAFAGLVGLEDEGLTAHAKGIDVALNISTPLVQGFPLLPVIDFDAYAKRDCPTTGTCPEDKLDPFQVKVAAPSELGGEAPAEDFMFPGLLVRASVADINIDVFGVLAVRGSIALELGPQVDVTLTNGNVVEGVTTLTLGGANLLGFVGVNGPHWTEDEDGNVIWKGGCVPGPNVDCEVVLNPDAVGIGISDLDFGIFIGLKGDVTNPNVFIAADVRVDGFGLVGLPDGFTAAGTLAVALNLGFGLAGLAGIDFKRSFTYDPDGEQEEPGDPGSQCASGEVIEGDPHCDDLPGLALNSGNDDNPILIDFEDTFISVSSPA